MLQKDLPSFFNTWTSLFLGISVLGFLLAFLLFTDKQSRKNNWPIILLSVAFSMILIQYVFLWTGYKRYYPYVFLFDSSWYLAFGPLLYVYVVQFYYKDYKTSLFHFVPAFIVFIPSFYYLFLTDGFTNNEAVKSEILYVLMWKIRNGWLPLMSFIAYFLMIRDFIQIYDKDDKTTQVYQLRHKWIKYIVNFFGLFTLAYASYYILVEFPFFNPNWDYAISLTMSIAIYIMAYMVYKEPQVFNGELLAKIFMPESEHKNQLSTDTKEAFYQKLLNFMEQQKPYLDSDLRLVNLADQLGFSSHLLSQIINEMAKENFNHFVNEHRLKEAEKLLLSDASTSIKNIYLSVGFNNKATFYTAFRKKHACTPSEFKQQHFQLNTLQKR